MKFNDLFDIENFNYRWDVIENIPEFAELKICEQNPKWHSEGNAWNHTIKVCEAALSHCTKSPNDTANRSLLLAALFHDIGKGVATEFKKGNWHAYGHEIAGEKITRRLLWDEDIYFREEVCSLVRWHMEPLNIIKSSHYIEKIFELAKHVNLSLLFTVKTFDIKGSFPENVRQTEYDLFCINMLTTIAIETKIYYSFPFYLRLPKPTMETFDKEYIYVHVMIGISGAGKSTEVEKLIEGKDKDSYVIVSRDIARVALKYCSGDEKYLGTTEEENMVTAYCHELIRESAKLGKTIIIDDMNIKKKYRDSFKNILKDYNPLYFYHYVEASSIDENIKRREGQVPENVIMRMVESIEWPSGDEYFKIYITRN